MAVESGARPEVAGCEACEASCGMCVGSGVVGSGGVGSGFSWIPTSSRRREHPDQAILKLEPFAELLDADPLVPFDGSPLAPNSGAVTSAEFWARNNGCASTATKTDLPDRDPTDGTTVVRFDYRGCPKDAPVVLLQIKGGGHNWPGGIPFLGPLLGPTTHDIDANQVIWEFVSPFKLAA